MKNLLGILPNVDQVQKPPTVPAPPVTAIFLTDENGAILMDQNLDLLATDQYS